MHRRDYNFTFTPREARILDQKRDQFRGGLRGYLYVSGVYKRRLISQLVTRGYIELLRCVKIGAWLSHCDWPHQLPDYTATCCVAGQTLVDGRSTVIQQPRLDINMNAIK